MTSLENITDAQYEVLAIGSKIHATSLEHITDAQYKLLAIAPKIPATLSFVVSASGALAQKFFYHEGPH